MAVAQTIWGIDLGRCALKAIKLRSAGDGKVEILAHDYVEHAKILSQPDADRPALIAAALEKFLSRNDITKDQIVVSVPGQHTLARFTKLPPVQPKRIPDIVRYEADQQIPFDMDEVIWDYQTFQEEGAPDIEVGIFAMKRELIREHLLHFEQAAIEPIGVQAGPLAVYNGVVFDSLMAKDTTIILDIGAESTDLIIGTPNNLWTRTINIGGNSLTETLVKSFKLSFAKAENLKRTAATSKYARQIFQAMRPVFADLVQELQRSFGYYSSMHREAKFEKVIAVGNAMLLPGLQKYLQQNLGLTVDKPESFRNATATAPAGSQLAEQHPSFWVAYGLALQGAELTKVTSNLLPTEIAKQVVWRKKRPAFAAAAACLLLSGGIMWFRYTTDSSVIAASSLGADDVNVKPDQALPIIEDGPGSGQSDRAHAATILQAAEQMKKQYTAIASQGKSEQEEMEKIDGLMKNKAVIPAIFQVIHESLPKQKAPVRTAADYAAAAAATPRAQREEITIQELSTEYKADVNEPAWEKSLIDVPPRTEKDDEVVPGLIVEIICSTPNSGGQQFVKSTFVDALRTNGRKPGTGFYIDRVWITQGGKGELPKRGGVGSHQGRPDSADEKSAKDFDPVTGESAAEDWVYRIWADVIFKDFAPPEEAAAEEQPEKGDDGG